MSLQITPKTKVAELFDAFPELEEVLNSIAPAFRKLRNPVLRRTVARVATLQQAALTGEVDVGTVVRTLRQAAGQTADVTREDAPLPDAERGNAPDWTECEAVRNIDAGEIIDAGGNPLASVLRVLRELGDGQVLDFSVPFYPAPMIDVLQANGHCTWCEKRGSCTVLRVRTAARAA